MPVNRPILLSLLGLAVASAAVGLALSLGSEDDRRLEVLPPPDTATVLPSASPDAIDIEVVRIGEKGDTVIAGRGKPKSEIFVRLDGLLIGTVTADSRGEWVVVPSAPLQAGMQLLTLGEADGPVSVIAAMVPASSQHSAHTVLIPAKGKLRHVSRPTGADFTLLSVERGGEERLRVSGRAEPNRTIQALSDGKILAKAASGINGDWLLEMAAPSGDSIGLEALDSKGKAKTRIEARVPAPALVGQGPSLERIAPDGFRIALPDGRAVHLFPPHAAP